MLFFDRYGPVGNLLIHLISTDSHCPGRNFATSSPGRFSLGALEKAPSGRGCQFANHQSLEKRWVMVWFVRQTFMVLTRCFFLLTLLVRFASKLEWLLYLLYD